MSERCPLCGKTDRALFGALFIRARMAASKNDQLVGEKNDLYVTMEQLHEIMLGIAQEEASNGGR